MQYDQAVAFLRDGRMPVALEMLKTVDVEYEKTAELINECEKYINYYGRWRSIESKVSRGDGSVKSHTGSFIIRFYVLVEEDSIQTLIDVDNREGDYCLYDDHFTRVDKTDQYEDTESLYFLTGLYERSYYNYNDGLESFREQGEYFRNEVNPD